MKTIKSLKRNTKKQDFSKRISVFFPATLFERSFLYRKEKTEKRKPNHFKKLFVYGMGIVFVFSGFSLQAQNRCKELFTPEDFSKSMTENLVLGRNQKDLFDFYQANFFGDSQTSIKNNFKNLMDVLEKHPELSKPVFREQKITFGRKNYTVPESLNNFIKKFTSLYGSQKSKLFNISENLYFWKKILGFNKSEQENFTNYFEQFLSEKDFDYLADNSISYKQRAVFLYKILDKSRENQIKEGKEAQRLSQIMLDLVHTVGLGDPYYSALLKSQNAIDRLQALHKILDERDAMAIELGFKGHFLELQKTLGITSPSSFSKKENIYGILRGIEEEMLQSPSHLADSQTFRLRALSLQESPFRSCLGGSDCSSNTYFFKALDPNFIYWTLTDKEHRSLGQITVVLGEAQDERGERLLVGFVDKIQNVPRERIAPMLEGIRRSLEEKGYRLGLPQDVGNHNGLSNGPATRKYIDKDLNSKLEKQFLEFTPHEKSYNFENRYSRAYNKLSLYEFQTGSLNLEVKIELGEAYLPKQAPEALKTRDLFNLILSLRSSKREEDQLRFIKQVELLYNLKILSFEELKEDLVDRVKDRGFSFKLRKLSFFSLIELYGSSRKDLSYYKILEFLSEFSKKEQKTLMGEMSNWISGNNLKRKTFIESLFVYREEKEIISILKSEILKPLVDASLKKIKDNSPLRWAIEYYKPNLVKLLVEKGSDIHAVDFEGKNALMWAIISIEPDLAKILIEKGSDIHTVDSWGINALMYAIDSKQPDLAKILIEKGSDIHAIDSKGINALMWAIKFEQPDLAKILIEKGSDIHAVDSKGKNALMYAIDSKQPDLAKILIEKGSDIHAVDSKGKNALMYAIDSKQPDLAKILIEKGSDIHAVDSKGRNASMYAPEYKQADLAKLLIEKSILKSERVSAHKK